MSLSLSPHMSVILSILDRVHMLTAWIPTIEKNVTDYFLVQNNVTAVWMRYNKFTYLK